MGSMNWEVTAFRDGHSFEFKHRVSGPFIMRFMMLFMAGTIRRGVRGDLEKLKELME